MFSTSTINSIKICAPSNSREKYHTHNRIIVMGMCATQQIKCGRERVIGIVCLSVCVFVPPQILHPVNSVTDDDSGFKCSSLSNNTLHMYYYFISIHYISIELTLTEIPILYVNEHVKLERTRWCEGIHIRNPYCIGKST